MKFTITITDITTWGGVERITLLLAKALIEKGHTVSILSLFKKHQSLKFDAGSVKIDYVINSGYTLNSKANNRIIAFKSVVYAYKEIIKHIDKSTNTIYIAQCFLPAFILWMRGKAKQTIVCEHFKYEIYNPIVCFLRDKIYKRFLQIITLTKEDCDKYKRRLTNVRVIPNISPFSTIKKANLMSKRIISVGRLTHQKGYDYLLESIKLMKDNLDGWTFHVYGDGELREQLEKHAKQLRIDNVITFEGFSDNIEKEMLSSSIYVLSSRFEGLPLVLLEAMSCGLPIVSFDCPEGPKSLIGNGAGILVKPESPQDLANALQKLINSYSLRETLSLRSHERSKKYSKASVIALWDNLFHDLLINS